MADPEMAIQRFQEAVNATPADHPDRAGRLHDLGSVDHERYQRTGSMADLETIIQRYQEAIDMTPADHPDRARRLHSLASGYGDRYRRTGAMANLETAIQRYQEAVDATPTNHPDRAVRLHSLGLGYRDRYQRTGTMADLETAIQRSQEALDATPADHPDQAQRLDNFGVGYRDRYRRTETMADLETAIQRSQEALDMTPADHPDRAGQLHALGARYHDRYQRTGTMTDLEAAIQHCREALDGYLADTYWNQGRRKEAEELGVQVMKTCLKVLGQEHSNTLTSMANLASIYRIQGRWKEAEELGLQVMETRTRVLGQEHLDTLTSMVNLAWIYRDQGRRKEAEGLDVQVMETRKRVLRISMSAEQDEETMAQSEASEASDVESIFSLASHSTVPSTVPSSSLRKVLASATDQLVTLLVNDHILHSLFLASVEAKNIGGERFARNFRRLLRIFARDLRIEAHKPVEDAAAHLLQSHATDITGSIRARYDFGYRKIYMPIGQHDLEDKNLKKERLEKYLQEQINRQVSEPRLGYSLSMRPNADPDTSEANPEQPPKSDVEDISSDDESQVGDDLRNIEQVKQFIVESNAYSRLRQAFKEFVQPSSDQATKAPKASDPTDMTMPVVFVPKVIRVTMASELSGESERAQPQPSLVPVILWHQL